MIKEDSVMNDIEKFKKHENDLSFRHYNFLMKKQTYKNTLNIRTISVFILLIDLMQMILMLLLLDK